MSSFVAAALLLQSVPLPLTAQTIPQTPLVITVLTGSGMSPGGKHPVAEPLAIRVETESHQQVAGALVFFAAPNYGASGTFLDSMKTMQVVTDASGLATANGFRSNDTRGSYEVRVMVMAAGQTGYTAITRVNEGHSGVSKRTWWIVAGSIAAIAIGGGTYLAVRGHSHTTTTTVGSGGVTIGNP